MMNRKGGNNFEKLFSLVISHDWNGDLFNWFYISFS